MTQAQQNHMNGKPQSPDPEELRLVLVDKENVPRALDMGARGLLQSAADRSHGKWTIEVIEKALVSGDDGLYVVLDGSKILCAAVASVQSYPSGRKVFEIPYLGGEHRKLWLHFRGHLEETAKRWGCHAIQAWARKGWERELSDWKRTVFLLEKDLTDDGKVSTDKTH